MSYMVGNPGPVFPVRAEMQQRFNDIAGGGGGKMVLMDAALEARVKADEASNRVFRYADSLVDSMKDFRSNYDENWDFYFNILMGRQWVSPSTMALRSPRLANWRARLNINFTYAIMDTIASTVFDNDPKLSLQCTAPEQQGYVSALQAAVDQIWRESECETKCRDAFFNALTFGVGYLKPIWNPKGAEGAGCVEVHVVPSQNLYVDKNATNFKDYKIVVEEEVQPLSYVKKLFPKKADRIRPEGDVQTFAEKATQGGFNGFWPDKPVSLYSPADDNPRIADKTDFSTPPYRTASARGDSMIKMYHLWISPEECLGTAGSTKTITKTVVMGYDMWRRPINMYKQEEVPRYPHGRLITIGGGMVLQDVPNPYRCLPYVVFKDIRRSGEFYGKGEPELLFDLQQELNRRRSQLTDNAALMANAVWVVEADAGVPSNMIMNTPGLIVRTNQGGLNKIRREAPPEMPAWFMRAVDMPVNDMMTISGVGGAGNASVKGARSGSAMQEGHAQQTQRVRYKGKNVEQAMQDLGKILITFIQDFYTTPRMVRIVGNYGTQSFVPFDKYHARGQWDVAIDSAAAANTTRVAREQLALQLFDKGIADKRFVIDNVDMPGKEELLRRTGDPGWPQVPRYPGWPGTPNPMRQDTSGYSLQARAVQAQPPPMAAPPGGAPPKQPTKGPGHGPGPHRGGPRIGGHQPAPR